MEKFLTVEIDTPIVSSRTELSFKYDQDTTVNDVKKMIVQYLYLKEGYENKLKLRLSGLDMLERSGSSGPPKNKLREELEGKDLEARFLMKDLEAVSPQGMRFHVSIK